MRVALVWNHPSRLRDCSFRFEQYVAGLEALGHEAFVVCAAESAHGGFPAPVLTAERADRFRDPSFWRGVGAEAAIVVTWHRMSAELKAMDRAGTAPLALADTDGRIGYLAHPRVSFERLWLYREGGARDAARRVRYWFRRAIGEAFRPSVEETEAIASTRASRIVALGHAEGVAAFRRFLARRGAADLAARVVEVPFTIGASFLAAPVPTAKERRIVAIGRWQDPQKNAPLLGQALGRFLAAHPEFRVDLYGEGGEGSFAELIGRHEGARYHGVQPQEVVARALGRARSILFASRWEGCPHAACEALALGATLVGPALPALESWIETGRFGTVSARRSATALAGALASEIWAWSNGERDPQAISSRWRARLDPREVCRRLLEAGGLAASSGIRSQPPGPRDEDGMVRASEPEQ